MFEVGKSRSPNNKPFRNFPKVGFAQISILLLNRVQIIVPTRAKANDEHFHVVRLVFVVEENETREFLNFATLVSEQLKATFHFLHFSLT